MSKSGASARLMAGRGNSGGQGSIAPVREAPRSPASSDHLRFLTISISFLGAKIGAPSLSVIKPTRPASCSWVSLKVRYRTILSCWLAARPFSEGCL